MSETALAGDTALAVEIREGTGKGVARKLRRAGRIPAVLYGHGKTNVNLTIDPVSLERLLRESDAGINTLFDLAGAQSVNGRTVLLKQLQRDPVYGNVVHADLFQVDLLEKIVVSVPVHLQGTPKGVSLDGGILDFALREIELACLPRAIPDQLELDVSEVELGGSLHVRDLLLPDGVELRSDPDLSVLSVIAPAAAEEEPAEVVEGELPEGEEAPAEGEEAAPAAEGSKEKGEASES